MSINLSFFNCRVPTILQSVDRDHILLQLLDDWVCAGPEVCEIRAASVDSKGAVEPQQVRHAANTAQHFQEPRQYRLLYCDMHPSLTLVSWLYTNVDIRDAVAASHIEQS